MSDGPWTKYQAASAPAETGPWTKYTPPARPKAQAAKAPASASKVGVVEDAARGGFGGLLQGVIAAGGANPVGGGLSSMGDPLALGSFLARKVLEGAGAINHLQSKRLAVVNAKARDAVGANTTSERLATPVAHTIGADYQAKTIPGRTAQTVGQFAAGALVPGSLATRAAAVLVPAAASEAGGEAAHAAGASPQVEAGVRVAGALAGGAGLAAGPRLAGMAGIGRSVDAAAGVTEANAALTRMGVNPAELPPAAHTQIEGLIAQGGHPEDVAAHVLAQSLPQRVPLTRGQMSGSPEHQAVESATARGTNGTDPAAVMTTQRMEAQDALRANVDAVHEGIGGGPVPRGEGAARASDALNTAADTQRTAVDTAYDAARQTGEGASLPAAQRPVVAAHLRESVRDFDPITVAPVTRELDRLDGLSGVTARDLFESRTRLGNLRVSNDPVTATAAGRAVRALDGYIDDALAADLFTGDPQAVASWRAAIGARRAYGRRFEAGDMVERLTKREPRGGAMTLSVAPEDAANYLLGRSGLGFVGRANFRRDLIGLRNALGANSPEWHGLRAEIFRRFAEAGESDAGRTFSGQKFATAWRQARQRDAGLIDEMFSEQERATIDRLAAISRRVTSPVAGGMNTSNTATVARILQRARAVTRSLPGVGALISALEDAANMRTANEMAYPAGPGRGAPRRPLPGFMPDRALPGVVTSPSAATQGLLRGP